MTTVTLEGASHFLEGMGGTRGIKALSGLDSELHRTASPDASKRKFGLAPWHRRNSQTSVISVTDSVRDLLMGPTPIPTPRPEATYTGNKGQSYQKGEFKRFFDKA